MGFVGMPKWLKRLQVRRNEFATNSCEYLIVTKDSSYQRTREVHNGIDVWQTVVEFREYGLKPPFESFEFLLGCDPEMPTRMFSSAFRGVSIDRLAAVLEMGIDVQPTDSIIYVSDFDKAWEYGGVPKVILELDRSFLHSTYREIPSDTVAADIADLQKHFPCVEKSRDGSKLWLSRLAENDPRRNNAYEINYAKLIPENARHALKAIFIFATEYIDLASLIRKTR
jgi:predicted AAA+ superfamily ATPase